MIAYVSAEGRPSTARRIAARHLAAGRREIKVTLPMQPVPELAHAAYDEAASRIGAELEQGHDVAVLCEGDPFLYGSFAQLFDRLGESYPTEVVPGIVSFTAAAAAAARALSFAARKAWWSCLPRCRRTRLRHACFKSTPQ